MYARNIVMCSERFQYDDICVMYARNIVMCSERFHFVCKLSDLELRRRKFS